MKICIILFIPAILFIYGLSVSAQDKTIKVWPDKIPGAIYNPSYKPDTTYIEGKVYSIAKVSDPTIDIYFPHSKKANGTAVIICPGGGYGSICVLHEGSDIAAWLNDIGITAVVLKYRLPNDAIMHNKSIGPLQDAQEAIRIIRRNSKKWNINYNRIGIIGFSAGGHLASTVSTHFNDKVYETKDTTSARPDFSILVYPVISLDTAITHRGSRSNLIGKNPSPDLVRYFSNELRVTKDTPPAFLVLGIDDKVVPIQNSINYMLAMKNNNVPCELHLYEKGVHGFALGKANILNHGNPPQSTVSAWTEACRKWLEVRGLL
jgi:acetyl esterase/lipase